MSNQGFELPFTLTFSIDAFLIESIAFINVFLSLRLEGEETLKFRCIEISLVVSVGLRSEKFNIVSNDHGRTQNCDFCVLVCKNNFTDHHTPNTIYRFRDSVLVCKMPDC